MKYTHFKTRSIGEGDDNYQTIIFVDEDGRHFHAALVSKLLPDTTVKKIENLIHQEINE